MNPSQTAISEKIEALDPARFQELVTEYVLIQFPGRFQSLQRRGSNTKGETIPGWPDGYAKMPDGRLDILEITHTDAWPRHLQADIKKASGTQFAGRIGGFLFVAWARTPEPTVSLRFERQLTSLGIPTDKIAFIFQEQLVSDMCQAKFALLWKKFLGLHPHCLPFYPIEHANLYGSGSQTNIFMPTREEYSNGLVHHSHLTPQVEQALKAHGWATVRGKGASGKTVMAAQIALGPEFRRSPVYYLDLSDLVSSNETDSSRALDVITWRRDQGILFIVDNIHLNEQMAREIFDYWKGYPAGSYLLLLGRWTESVPNSRGVAAPFESIDQEILILEVKEADLLGVLHRLAFRSGLKDRIGIPPGEAVANWLSLFGGDLIAFSAAVALRIRQMARGEWALTGEDAKYYVQSTYLYPPDNALTADELHNLLLIAVLSKIELATPHAAIRRGDIRKSLGIGLVHSTDRSDDQIGRFRLVHPGFGELLVSAADPPVEELTFYRDFAVRVPGNAVILTSRLETIGERDAAVAVAGLLAEDSKRLRSALLAGCSCVLTSLGCDLLQRLGHYSFEDTDEALSVDAASLSMAAVNTPLPELANFLRYSRQKLPKCYACIVAALGQPSNHIKIMEIVLRTPLELVASFLRHASSNRELDLVYTAIATGLSDPDKLTKLMDIALRMPLDRLVSFFSYAGSKLPNVHRSMTRELAKSPNLAKLSETLLRSEFDQLTSLLRYTELKLPQVYREIVDRLVHPTSLAKLSETLLRSEFDQLTSLLRYTELKLPQVYREIVDRLVHPTSLAKLSETALRSGLNPLTSFFQLCLNTKELRSLPTEILLRIDVPTWNRIRLESPPNQAHYMHTAALLFQRLGRPELMQAPAEAAILRPDASLWPVDVIGLHQLGQTLRLGHALNADALQHFLQIVVTESWLNKQYESATAGTIAACLFSVWAYSSRPIINHFVTGGLGRRLGMELSLLRHVQDHMLVGAISLFGCCSLVVGPLRVSPEWPTVEQITEMLSVAAPKQDLTEIGHVQVQLWLGVREMIRHMPKEIQISAELGEPVLALWRKAEPKLERFLLLNKVMIPWLDRCSKSQWRLLREPNSLYEEYSRQIPDLDTAMSG